MSPLKQFFIPLVGTNARSLFGESDPLDVCASPSAQNAPVVFWIHGGGEKSDVVEKPRFFVEKGFVFVPVNYHLLPKVEMIDILHDVISSSSPTSGTSYGRHR